MTSRRNFYRLSILAGLGLLLAVLAAMAVNLAVRIDDLSRAAGDNTQWSISQIDTEFANLDALLTEQVTSAIYPEREVRLRFDLALSRLNIINSGRSAELFSNSDAAEALIAPINAFADRAIAVLDAPGPLDSNKILELKNEVRAVRPAVRDVALLGVQLGAERAEARRHHFASQLAWTGGIAIGLLILMAVLLLLLDRMLRATERRDRELSASSKQLASTVAASLDAIVTADVDGRVIDFNASAERVFGWKKDEIVGRTMEETFIPHRMRDAHHNGMRRYIKTGQPRVVNAGRVELAALRKSGEEFPVELNITTAQSDDDTIFIAYIRDISERKINEQTLIDAREKAEQTDQAKSYFLAMMSHEMRTPLNGILGVLDLLKTTSLTDQQARYARIATSSSEVLLEHVNEALDITRIEAGNLQLTQQMFRLTDLMQGVLDMFEPLAQEKELALTLDIAPAMRGPYYGDASRIRQILTNLIGNAIKFTEKGSVELHVAGIHGPEMTSLRFAVVDSGVGIAPDQQEQIFEDFFARAATEGRQTRGDGLGLAISRRIARAMGGEVSVKSNEGEGSTFVLSLPLQRGDSLPGKELEPVQAKQPPQTVCSVLIVEDNSINRSVLADMLKSMGHHVHEAVNGEDALARAEEAIFDIIFMDISMPVMDGIEATTRLRARGGRNADSLIVGLTAHGREEYRHRALSAGMDRFQTKPIRFDALRSVISEVTAHAMPELDSAHYPEALVEMIDLLGVDRVRQTVDTFFGQLGQVIATLREKDVLQKQLELAEAVHRAKGAAALLGLSDLEAQLYEVERQARASVLQNAEDVAQHLDARATAAQALLRSALRTASYDT